MSPRLFNAVAETVNGSKPDYARALCFWGRVAFYVWCKPSLTSPFRQLSFGGNFCLSCTPVRNHMKIENFSTCCRCGFSVSSRRDEVRVMSDEPSKARPQRLPNIRNDPFPKARPTGASGEVSADLTSIRGFGPMTRISTSFGEMYAQTLRERDMVRTRSGDFARIERVDRLVLDEEFLRYHPQALPIRIRAGAFGRNLPAQDVTLAPFQPISSGQPFTGPKVGRAVDALGRPSVMRVAEPIITYTQIRCARPVSVLAEGLWIDI